MEFAIAFKAPPLPISICSGMGDVWSQRGGGGGGASVWSLCVLYYVEVFQFLLNKAVMHLGKDSFMFDTSRSQRKRNEI